MLRAHDAGGLEVLEADFHAFSAALASRNHTLKRALDGPSAVEWDREQTGGRLLAARALSCLLKKDWPRTLEELEALGGP